MHPRIVRKIHPALLRNLHRWWRCPVLLAALGILALLVLLGACGSNAGYIDHFKKNRIRCPQTDLDVPCEYGPDGLLYRFPEPE
jgi:hypothetical protein